MARQYDTALLIAKEIDYPKNKIRITDFLLERAGGVYEGKPQAEFFAASEAQQIAAGAESFEDLAKRAVRVVELARSDLS